MSAAPKVGDDFAAYRIQALLGEGGVGVVYLADDLRLSRRVALKVLRPELAADPGFRERFVRESRLAASIEHPNIVPIYEAGESDGALFIAMRRVCGTDLRSLLAGEGRLDPERAAAIVGQIAGALDAAHARGLCHRDVKPANILVVPRPAPDGSDQAYLADFGIAGDATSSGATWSGQFVGTAEYAAPEQIAGAAVGPRTDIYALGCVLYECLSGVSPFRRDSDIGTLQAHLNEPPPRLSPLRTEVGGAIDAVLATAMATRPEDRFPSATALASAARTALRATSSPPPPEGPPQPATVTMGLPALGPADAPGAGPTPRLAPRPRRRGVLAGAAGLIVVAAGAGVLVWHRQAATVGAPGPPAAGSTAQPGGGLRLDAALLTEHDFAPGSVTAATSDLRLADVACGTAPAGETEERHVAFNGRGSTSSRGYYNAAAAFPADADAAAYLQSLGRAAQSCDVRLTGAPPAPALGDGSARVLFPSSRHDFTFDAVYLRRGRAVALVLVSHAGTTPPAPVDAETFARVALRHMIEAGA